MSKIFGYKEEYGRDWYSIPDAYSDREIELVRDPEGGTVTTLPTAIPSDYLRKSLERTPNRLRQEIQELINNQPQENLNRYPELDTGVAGNVVEVLGVPLRKRHVEDMVAAVQKSDFMICATKSIPDPKPLVLQNNFNRDFKYINGNWDRNTQVPYLDPQPLDQRTLPNSQVRYPYLTVSDFLEPYLIRLVYPINRDKFFNGNLKVEVGNNNKHYLLPLKKEFFNYFKSDDLVNGGNDLPQIQMVQRAGGSVKVTLRIPVKRNNEYITFERIYYDGRQPDEFRNEGAVIELQFGVTTFPFIKLNDPTLRPFYRVQLIDRNITGNLMNTRCELRFFSNENQREVESTCRNRSRKPDASSHYYVLDQEFDYIQFQNSFASGVSGIIISKWRTYQSGNKIFHFAVDFGTTNTHIEYKVGNNVSQPFNITDADMQVATLFHPTETSEDFGGTGAIAIGELIDYEFVPQRIGDDAEYKFPQRTVIAVSNQLNINDQNNTVLADFNIPFVYEKKPERDKIHSNLKWSEMNPESKQIIKAYFEEIMMLLRNKVLLNGGNLAETRLVWFYPSSMTLGRLAYLEEL
jgi:hypothetical protein